MTVEGGNGGRERGEREGRERDRDRQRHRDRQTERQRQIDRQTDSQSEDKIIRVYYRRIKISVSAGCLAYVSQMTNTAALSTAN